MGYVRITILLVDGRRRSGVRRFGEPIIVEDIRNQARKLAAEVLGRSVIEDVIVMELPADDPAVVALILHEGRRNKIVIQSDGVHPYLKQRGGKPPR